MKAFFKTKNFCALSTTLSAFALLSSCNSSSGSSDAVVATTDTPYVAASCSTARANVDRTDRTVGTVRTVRTLPPACGNDSSTAVFSMYPSSSGRTEECIELLARIGSGQVLPPAYATAVTAVVCDGTTCQATPASVWLDSAGHVVSKIPKGHYTVFVRFTDDESSDVKPTDALLCQSSGFDDDHHDADLNEGNLGDAHIPVAAIPQLTVSCTASGNVNCDQDLDGNWITAAFFKDKTCAALQTEIESHSQVVSLPSAVFSNDVRSRAAPVSLACHPASGRGTVPAGCSYNIPFSTNWLDGGFAVTDLKSGSYAVLSVINGDVARAENGGLKLNSRDVVQCATTTLGAPTDTDAPTLTMTDANIAPIHWPALVNPPSVQAHCTVGGNPGCTTDLVATSGYMLAFKDKTCTQIVSALQGGATNSLAPNARTQSTVSCNMPSDNATMTCNFENSEWSNEIPTGQYAIATIMDRFNDLDQLGHPNVGDLIQCRTFTVADVKGTDLVLGDTEIQTVAWKDNLTPALTFSCATSVNPLCTAQLSGASNLIYLVGHNVSCSDLVTNGIDEETFFTKMIAVGGHMPKNSLDANRGDFPPKSFTCNGGSSRGENVNCSLSITPSTDMYMLGDAEQHNNYFPFRYIRGGGPFTVVAATGVGQRTNGTLGTNRTVDPSNILFCKEYSSWGASTSSLSLLSSDLQAFAPSPSATR